MATNRTHPIRPMNKIGTCFLQDTTWPAEGAPLEWGTGSGNRLRVKVNTTANTRNFAGLYSARFSPQISNNTATDAPISPIDGGVAHGLMTGTGAAYAEVRCWGGKLGGAGDEASPVYVGRALAAWADGDLVPIELYDAPSAG